MEMKKFTIIRSTSKRLIHIFVLFLVSLGLSKITPIHADELDEYFRGKYGEQWIDIVFDIDGTLAFRDPHPSHGPPDITVDGRPYKLAHGAVELIAGLKRMKGTFSFFSLGEASRNNELLAKLFAHVEHRTGQTPPTYTVLSRDLIPPNGKKNLNLLTTKNLSLDRTVLFDDHAYVSYEGQERNLLSIYYDMNDMILDGDRPESDTEQLEQVRIKNNLVRAAGVFLTALENAKKNGTEIADELGKIESVYRSPHPSETNSKEIYLKGLAFLKTINPSFELYTEKSLFHPPSIVFPYSVVPSTNGEATDLLPKHIVAKLLKKVVRIRSHKKNCGKKTLSPPENDGKTVQPSQRESEHN